METTKPLMFYYHGYGQTKETATTKNKALFERLKTDFNLLVFEAPYLSIGFHEEIKGKSWWPTDNVIQELTDPLDIDLSQFISQVLPADVLIGFSQGGNLILRALEKNPDLCKVAVVCNGLLGNIKTEIKTPVIFAFGDRDPFVNSVQQERLLSKAPNHEVIMMNTPHAISQNEVFCEDLVVRIKKYL